VIFYFLRARVTAEKNSVVLSSIHISLGGWGA